MIRVICLNPVIDRVYNISDFQAGKQCKEVSPDIFVGGKGVNIARVVSNLGECCTLYSYIGGSNGQLVIQDIKPENVDFKYVEISGETRITINIIDKKSGVETEITETGPNVSPNERNALINLLVDDISENDIVVCSGITINGVEEDIYKFVSNICNKKKAKCIIDTNNDSLKKSLPAQFYAAKPNIDELKEFFNHQGALSFEEAIVLCRKMINMGIENVLLTLGKDGALLITKDHVFSATVPEIQKVSSIGSGDATVGGLCVGLLRNLDYIENFKLALACGTANATFKKIGYVTKESVDSLVKEIRVNETTKRYIK